MAWYASVASHSSSPCSGVELWKHVAAPSVVFVITVLHGKDHTARPLVLWCSLLVCTGTGRQLGIEEQEDDSAMEENLMEIDGEAGT